MADLFKEAKTYFSNHFWPINPLGNFEAAQNRFAWTVKNEVKDKEGVLLTAEELTERYRFYVSSLESFQNGKYTKHEYKIKVPFDWLESENWNDKVITKKDPADFYLFGNMLDD